MQEAKPAIDLCVALDGPMVGLMLPIFMDSLFEHTDLDGLNFHFIDRSQNPAVRKYLNQYRHLMPISIPEEFEPRFSERESAKYSENIGRTVDWMIRTCGSSEWVFISHFDVEFNGDWINHYRSAICPSLAQIGCHQSGMVAYRRKAAIECTVGCSSHDYQACGGLFVCKNELGNWSLRCGSDHRLDDKAIEINGFDVGEMVEINLQEQGWGILIEPPANWLEWRYHQGGSFQGHKGNYDEMIMRARERLKHRELSPIIL